MRATLFAGSTDGPVIRRAGGYFAQYREPEQWRRPTMEPGDLARLYRSAA